MKTTSYHFSNQSTNRRKFLKATAAAAGLSLLGFNMPSVSDTEETPEEISAESTVDQKMITIRAHHLFCMMEPIATGKSSHKTLGPVAQMIRDNPRTPLKIVIGMDDVCSPCEWWDHNKMRCLSGIDKYPLNNDNDFDSDRNLIRVLGIKEGDIINADEVYRMIKNKVTVKVFAEEACVACRVVNDCAKTYEKKIEAAVNALSQ